MLSMKAIVVFRTDMKGMKIIKENKEDDDFHIGSHSSCSSQTI